MILVRTSLTSSDSEVVDLVSESLTVTGHKYHMGHITRITPFHTLLEIWALCSDRSVFSSNRTQ